MGAVVDTTVFVDVEREARQRRITDPAGLIGHRLESCLGPEEEAGLSAITASELLHGIHRVTSRHRARREAFVESVLAAVPTLEFDLLAARAHARLWADLAQRGQDVGPHDRIVAATALSRGWRVATSNTKHFARIPGLEVVEVPAAR